MLDAKLIRPIRWYNWHEGVLAGIGLRDLRCSHRNLKFIVDGCLAENARVSRNWIAVDMVSGRAGSLRRPADQASSHEQA